MFTAGATMRMDERRVETGGDVEPAEFLVVACAVLAGHDAHLSPGRLGVLVVPRHAATMFASLISEYLPAGRPDSVRVHLGNRSLGHAGGDEEPRTAAAVRARVPAGPQRDGAGVLPREGRYHSGAATAVRRSHLDAVHRVLHAHHAAPHAPRPNPAARTLKPGFGLRPRAQSRVQHGALVLRIHRATAGREECVHSVWDGGAASPLRVLLTVFHRDLPEKD